MLTLLVNPLILHRKQWTTGIECESTFSNHHIVQEKNISVVYENRLLILAILQDLTSLDSTKSIMIEIHISFNQSTNLHFLIKTIKFRFNLPAFESINNGGFQSFSLYHPTTSRNSRWNNQESLASLVGTGDQVVISVTSIPPPQSFVQPRAHQ